MLAAAPATLIRLSSVVRVSLAATSLKYAAMFSVLSNSLHLLTDESAIDFSSASMPMVLFGFGRIAGAAVSGMLSRTYSTLVPLIPPATLALAFLLRYIFARGPDFVTGVAVLAGGAAHSSAMLVTHSTLRPIAPGEPDVTTALHVCAGCVGVLTGVAIVAVFSTVFGTVAIFLCGISLAIFSFAVVATQLSRMETDATIVALQSTD
ncbi:hypothetical protein [Paraburkholderia dipogonis]|uniref:hypothetical protein n=1 Tax=Paraburkholderia dipogonis TaxID=1211383 RepID=UPI0038BCFF6D